MCTAATLRTEDFYFGRTLDNEFSYREEVVVTPRVFHLPLRHLPTLERHFAFIGMAYVPDDFPLYYDGVNEKGLCIAGLNFVGNAQYEKAREGAKNVAQWELVPYLLGTCASVDEAEELIRNIRIVDTPYSEQLPVAQLHWMISDGKHTIVVESMADGVHIYDNPLGVMANNPPFPMQMAHLSQFKHLSPNEPNNRFGDFVDLKSTSKGVGALGLPGDLTSPSRFVRVGFTKCHSLCEPDERSSVHQFFHVLCSVDQVRGVNRTAHGNEISIYTSCCNATKGIYYYITYDNSQITAVDMRREDLDSATLARYPLVTVGDIKWMN